MNKYYYVFKILHNTYMYNNVVRKQSVVLLSCYSMEVVWQPTSV